jgi:predicted ATP-dependent serine protease
MAYDKIEDKTRWAQEAKEHENHELVTNGSHVTSDNSDNVIISLSAKDELKGKRMSIEDRERALHMYFFLESILPRGFHIIIYGAAGSGKTTIVLHLMKELLKRHDKAEVYYLYLDGQLGMAANYEEHLEEEGLIDRYNIITEGTAEELMCSVEELVSESKHPEKIIIVLDTLKYLNPDIISKSTNAKVLHRIKALTGKGVTFISLHHTNKDGENFAGTAEIEQDCDALLKLVTMDGEEEHTKISTLIEGGRVRYFFEEQSFTFKKGDPGSVEMIDRQIDTAKLAQQKQDSYLITIIKGILTSKGSISKSELEGLVKEDDDFDGSNKELKSVLKRYVNTHWQIKKTGERNHIHMYSVIDTVSKSIDSIQSQISVP